MKFNFSFQKVLDFKENEKELAQQEYGTIKQKQIELQSNIDELEHVQNEVFNQYNKLERKPVWQILEVQQEIEHVNLRIKNLKVRSQEIHSELEKKQQVLLEKSQEAKMWNQWKDKSKEVFQKQQDQKEQAILDEMAVLRYFRKL